MALNAKASPNDFPHLSVPFRLPCAFGLLSLGGQDETSICQGAKETQGRSSHSEELPKEKPLREFDKLKTSS